MGAENVDRLVKVIFLSLLPVPIAALLMLLTSSLLDTQTLSLQSYFTLVYFGYLLGIVPSLFFCALMEYVVVPKLFENSTIKAVTTFFGVISGAIIGWFASGMSVGNSIGDLIEIALVGGTVGYIMGRFYCHPSIKHKTQGVDGFIEPRQEVRQHEKEKKHPESVVPTSVNITASVKRPLNFWWSIFGLSALQFCAMLALVFSKELTTIASLITVIALILLSQFCLLVLLLCLKSFKQAGVAAVLFIIFALIFSGIFTLVASSA